MKNSISLFILLMSLVPIIISCNRTSVPGVRHSTEVKIPSNEHLSMAVLYQQTAAEYRALCYQAFNLARFQLDQNLKMMGLMKQQAIVVDIDETMLDNSPYEAKCILEGISYPEGWEDWMDHANAKPVPGALEFLQYAESKEIEVYYITNRREKYREQTLKNLQDQGFPNAVNDHLFLRTDTGSKKARRDRVAETRKIILLIGDNLNDFSEKFEKLPIQDRFALTDSMKESFGTQFIVLPNAMYGEWEGALYNYDYSIENETKYKLRTSNLSGF